ncbi:MAG: CoA transferase [Dehalococcoidia bacterium]|nr:CoA transferase [Dehalococcoidia bacterium]
MATPPLAGIRVLEVANWLAGPSCAALLADLGADVVKVEPPQGDAFRYLLMSSAGYQTPFEHSPAFELDNRGKRSISLDIDKPEGREILMKLAAKADIVVTNLVPARRAKYGFTPEDVHAINPTAIFASVTGYGSVGPDANRAGYDHTSFWARSGIMALMGEAGAAPSSCRGGMGDHTTGLNMLAAIMVALRLRDQTGEGQFVDIALQQTGMWTLGLDIEAAAAANEVPLKRTRKEARNPTANIYMTRDGRYIFLMMPTADYWPKLCTMLGHEEWLADERYATVESRGDHNEVLIPAVEALFAEKDYADWMRILDEHGMIYAPIPTVTEVIADPQPRAMGVFTTIQDHPRFGDFEILDTPFNIRGADIGVRGPAPAPGEHTYDVLAELGIEGDDLANYAATGVFG